MEVIQPLRAMESEAKARSVDSRTLDFVVSFQR